MKRNSTDWLKTAAVVLVLFSLWILTARMGIFSSYILPGPEKVLKAFVKMAASGELLSNTAASLIRVFIGFAVSFVLAFGFGILACLKPKADPYYRPILEFIRHIPPIALIPLLILWFGIGEMSKLIIIVLTAFFPIFINTEAGLKNCDPKLLEVGKVLHMTPVQQFFQIRLPAAAPSILTGMQIGLGYSWRAIVGAEMIAAASGLGYMILDAQSLSRSDKVLVGILMIGVLGLLMDTLFTKLIGKASWSKGNTHGQ